MKGYSWNSVGREVLMRCTDVLLGKTRSKFEAWSLLRNKVFVCFPLMTTEPGGNCELGQVRNSVWKSQCQVTKTHEPQRSSPRFVSQLPLLLTPSARAVPTLMQTWGASGVAQLADEGQPASPSVSWMNHWGSHIALQTTSKLMTVRCKLFQCENLAKLAVSLIYYHHHKKANNICTESRSTLLLQVAIKMNATIICILVPWTSVTWHQTCLRDRKSI